MVRIFVVTFGGIKRDPGSVLFGKTDFRGLLVGVHLDRERLRGAQNFEQERQFAKTLGDFRAKQGCFIAFDRVAQGARRPAIIHNLRAAFGMGAHPQLRHRQVVRVSNPIKFG